MDTAKLGASAYPSMDQYNDAVQHPNTAFLDPILKTGRTETDGFGIPVVLGGGFALTYIVTASGQKFAVRCFHKPATSLGTRYTQITQALQRVSGDYFVKFDYQTQGIRVNGNAYPVVKMDWINGETL